MGIFDGIKAKIANGKADRLEMKEKVLNYSMSDYDACFNQGVDWYVSYHESNVAKAWGCLDALTLLRKKVRDRTLERTWDMYHKEEYALLMKLIFLELKNRKLIERNEEGRIIKHW